MILKTTSPINGKTYEAVDEDDLIAQLKEDGHENIVLAPKPKPATVFQVEQIDIDAL